MSGTILADDMGIDGSVILSEGSTLQVDIRDPDEFDFIRMEGGLTIEDNVRLETRAAAGADPMSGESYPIIQNVFSVPVVGTFLGLPNFARLPNFIGSGLDALVFYGGNIDLSVIESVPMDFGDLPGFYPTRTSDIGPWHVATGPRLGTLRDAEADAFISVSAEGDDVDGMDDEDGVQFGVLAAGMDIAALNIDLQNAESAFVDAWD